MLENGVVTNEDFWSIPLMVTTDVDRPGMTVSSLEQSHIAVGIGRGSSQTTIQKEFSNMIKVFEH